MVDVITRFKLETTQYDSALRDAAKGLVNLTNTLSTAGKDFDRFAQKSVEQARALGQIESGATNVKDKLRDLVGAYNSVVKAYDSLTNEQKQSDYGKAMAASLDELQGRITSTKKELEEMKNSTKGSGSLLDELASKFGLSTKALTTWGAAIGAAVGALKVSKDAFFASEQNLDDWNRTVYSAQSTYEAFLTSLNTSDVGGFLDRIGQITKAAMDAYNAIDRLQTTQNVQTPQVAKRQSELNRFEAMLRTGRYIAPIDGRKATPGLKDGDKLTKEQKERVANQVENIIKELAGLTKNEVNAATDAIDKLFNEQSLRLSMSKQKFLAGTETIGTFEQNVDLGKKYQEWEINRQTAIDLAKAGHYDMMSEEQKRYINTTNPYQQYKGWSIFKDDGELYQTILTNIKNRTAKEQEYYSMLARSYRQINRVEGYKPYGSNGSTTPKLTTPEKAQAKVDQAIADYNQALKQAALEVKAGTISATDAKKKELVAEEALWKAMGDARQMYEVPGLKEKQQAVADKVVQLGGSVNKLIEEQKKAMESARELANAQKRLSDAQDKMAASLNANDYKAYTAAYQQYNQANAEVQRLQPQQFEPVTYEVEARTESALDAIRELDGITIEDKDVSITVTANTQAAVDALRDVEGITLTPKVVDVSIDADKMKGAFSYTENNMEAFIRRLHTHLANADLGSELYKNLTAQLADAQTLANLLQVAVKNGIDIAQFDPQTLFNKIFGENPGDYITNLDWQAIQDVINEELAKMDIAPIKLDFETGVVSSGKSKDKDGTQNAGDNPLKKITGNISTITGALQQLGVDVPEGFQKTLGVMQVITTILMAIQTLSSITATTSALKSIPIIGWFLHTGGVVHAANGFNGTVPGNMMSGDQVPAMLDSGELVLNRAQQGNLLAQLNQSSGGPAVKGETRIEADEMVLLIKNGASRKGVTIGEYLGL